MKYHLLKRQFKEYCGIFRFGNHLLLSNLHLQPPFKLKRSPFQNHTQILLLKVPTQKSTTSLVDR